MTDPLDVQVLIRAGAWKKVLPRVAKTCLVAARAAYAQRRRRAAAEVSVLLAGDAFVRSLNRNYRGQDKATNVLAFAAQEGDGPGPQPGATVMLGDVVVAYGTAAREAAREGKSLNDHLSHLVVHGVLHLMGHDHDTERKARAMERLETKVLAGIGIADPYVAPPALRNDRRRTAARPRRGR